MKKKFGALFMAGVLTLGNLFVPAMAADGEITIEAEDFISQSGGWGTSSASDFSGGKVASIYANPQANGKYVLEYEVEVPKSGNYEFYAIGSQRGVSWTTDWFVAVGEENNKATTYTKLRDLSYSADKGLYKEYKTEPLKLLKGTNTIYLTLNASDTQSSNQLVALIDCLTLKKAEDGAFSISNIEFPDTELGVFEKGKSVKFNMIFSAAAPETKKYEFKVTDLYQRRVSSGEITVEKGADSATVNMGAFDIGWYQLDILDGGNSIGGYYAFSVTQPLSARKQYEDTTLATDAAIEYDGDKSGARNTEFIRALKLAGYDWVRERGNASVTPESYMKLKRERDAAGIKAMDVSGGAYDMTFRSDLISQAYEFYKKAPSHMENTIDVYEIYNEQDLGSNTPENYAAYMKAAAIGISDSEENPYKSMCGLATYQGGWLDTAFQCGILDYSDIYNYHTHSEYEMRAVKHKVYNNAYTNGSPLPMYNGETGLHLPIDENGNNSIGQMRMSTRNAITSSMASISNGTTKHFWFLFRPYIENNGSFSCFHTSFMPYPMYSALANMTYQLGEAHIKGEVANMPEGVSGWLFDDGNGNDVACLFADGENYVSFNADSVKYSDMLGYEETKTAENGKVKIFVSEDPVFVKFNGRCDENDYYPFEYSRELVKKSFAPNERIIMQPIWTYASVSDVKSKGYIFNKGEEQVVTLNVYNFNQDLAMDGVIKVKTDKNIESDITEAPFSIKPMEKQTLTFTFKMTENADAGTSGNIMFYGNTAEGEEISPSVSMYQTSTAERTIPDEDRFAFDTFYKEDAWDLKNIAEGGKITMKGNEEEKSATFKIDFSGQNWAFPFYYIDDPSIFEGTAGFIFDRTCDKGITSEVSQMYIYMKDGRNYYSGAKSENKYTEGEKTCVFPWSTFHLYYSPLGGVDVRPFKFEDISHISIGISGGAKNQPAYTIKNFGCFYSDLSSDQMAQTKFVTFEGIEDGQVFEEGKVPTLTAYIPEDEIVNIRVMDVDNEYTDYKIDGDKVLIDFSKLKRGKHKIYVFAENDFRYQYFGQVDFYVS